MVPHLQQGVRHVRDSLVEERRLLRVDGVRHVVLERPRLCLRICFTIILFDRDVRHARGGGVLRERGSWYMLISSLSHVRRRRRREKRG